MKVLIKAALATGAALALTTLGGVLPASASEGPEPGPWEKYDYTFTLPAGTACKAEIEVHSVGAVRTTEVVKDRVYKDEWRDWSNTTWTNTQKKHHNSFNRRDGGDTIARIAQDGNSVRVKAEGDNWGQGYGVKGIVWSRGDISYKVINIGDEDPYNDKTVQLDLSDARLVVQVCDKIGSKPVWGQNVVPDEEP